MGRAGEPIEKVFVSIEADVGALLKQAAAGVDQVEKGFKEVQGVVSETDARLEIMKRTIKKVAEQTGKSFKQAGKEIRKAFAAENIQIDTGQLDAAVKSLEQDMRDAGDEAERTGSRVDTLKRGAIAAAKAIAAVGAAIAAAFKVSMEAAQGLRVELSFRLLAAQADQSSDEILDAMTRASQGTIDAVTLMRQANTAMQLSVARTPEEFEKLTRAAVTLGRAVGLDATQSLELLINAAGRRSTEVLDNLGISLADVNAEMEVMAQQQFGKAVSQLNQAQRNAAFMAATLEVANKRADALGGAMADLATDGEATVASFKNLKQELGEILLIMFNISESGGVMDRLVAGAKAWQRILVTIVALVQAWIATRNQLLQLQITSIEQLAEAYKENFNKIFSEFEGEFAQVLDPERFAEKIAQGIPPVSIIDPIVEATAEDALKLEDILDSLATQMIDATDQMNSQIRELEISHFERLGNIVRRGSERRFKIVQQFELRRIETIERANEQLAKLEEETARQRAEVEAEFRISQRREQEDFQRDMVRLRQRFVDNLADAVKNRDARAIVDLRRNFNRETQERTDDFQTKRQREREDQETRLRELADNERRRRREIQQSLAKQLSDQKQAHQRQLAELQQSQSQQIAAENSAYSRRRSELQRALSDRLADIAKELSDEEALNAEGAQRILEVLNQTFGVGGSIDALMESFASRRRQRMVVSVAFAPQGELAQTLSPEDLIPGSQNFAGFFQHGGSVIARKPTIAQFGEVPEMATFTPLSKMSSLSRDVTESTSNVNLNLSGTAPPGIRSGDRDQIAGVVLQALRESGGLRKR